jgi:hypothetical protein
MKLGKTIKDKIPKDDDVVVFQVIIRPADGSQQYALELMLTAGELRRVFEEVR